MLLLITISPKSFSKEALVIGSKSFTESIILAEILSVLLEEKFEQPVVRKFGLGGTKVAFEALLVESIDVYPEYTGTGYSMILKQEGEKEPKKVYQIVEREFQKKWGLLWSGPIGFNNTYALVVRKSDQRFHNVSKISQLSGKVDNYHYAAPYEFMERKDGHKGLVSAYALNFSPSNMLSMGAGLMYSAIRDKKVDFIVAYSTDGRIGAFDLKKLEDDRRYFPPYQAAFLGQAKVLNNNPNLKRAFQVLEGFISESEMVEMNDKVDRLKYEVGDVVRNFLISKQLISGKENFVQESHSNLFSYFLSKKDYLFKLIVEHLLLSFMALSLALLISLPIGILLTRVPKMARIVFPIVNTIQTIPSLALLGFLIPILGIGFAPAVLSLFLYSLLPLIRNTYTGITGVEKNYIEASKGIGLTGTQILFYVELPLAMPIIIAGFRTAMVIVIGTATLAALVGAGGLGDPIFRGVSTVNSNLILLGAIPAAILAIISDKLIGVSEKFLVSKGIRQRNSR